MNGARFVHDRLEEHGWDVLIADATKVKGLAPLACKTDKIGARVLATLSARDEDQASAGARSTRFSLLHRWQSNSAAVTAPSMQERRRIFARETARVRRARTRGMAFGRTCVVPNRPEFPAPKPRWTGASA